MPVCLFSLGSLLLHVAGRQSTLQVGQQRPARARVGTRNCIELGLPAFGPTGRRGPAECVPAGLMQSSSGQRVQHSFSIDWAARGALVFRAFLIRASALIDVAIVKVSLDGARRPWHFSSSLARRWAISAIRRLTSVLSRRLMQRPLRQCNRTRKHVGDIYRALDDFKLRLVASSRP